MNPNQERTPPVDWPVLPKTEMIDEILDIISNAAKLDKSVLVPDATMESLGIPSLDMVDILFAVEERYDIYIPLGDELTQAVYLYDLIEIMAAQMAAK